MLNERSATDAFDPIAGDLLDRSVSRDASTPAGAEVVITNPSPMADDVAAAENTNDLVGMVGPCGGGLVVRSFEALGHYFRSHVGRLPDADRLRVIMLDHTHHVVGDVDLEPGCGPSNSARSVARSVLGYQAALLVLVQARTGADTFPEFAETVRQVSQSLDRLEVKLLGVALATPAGLVRLDQTE